jgi:hypothetical protein
VQPHTVVTISSEEALERIKACFVCLEEQTTIAESDTSINLRCLNRECSEYWNKINFYLQARAERLQLPAVRDGRIEQPTTEEEARVILLDPTLSGASSMKPRSMYLEGYETGPRTHRLRCPICRLFTGVNFDVASNSERQLDGAFWVRPGQTPIHALANQARERESIPGRAEPDTMARCRSCWEEAPLGDYIEVVEQE